MNSGKKKKALLTNSPGGDGKIRNLQDRPADSFFFARYSEYLSARRKSPARSVPEIECQTQLTAEASAASGRVGKWRVERLVASPAFCMPTSRAIVRFFGFDMPVHFRPRSRAHSPGNCAGTPRRKSWRPKRKSVPRYRRSLRRQCRPARLPRLPALRSRVPDTVSSSRRKSSRMRPAPPE